MKRNIKLILCILCTLETLSCKESKVEYGLIAPETIIYSKPNRRASMIRKMEQALACEILGEKAFKRKKIGGYDIWVKVDCNGAVGYIQNKFYIAYSPDLEFLLKNKQNLLLFNDFDKLFRGYYISHHKGNQQIALSFDIDVEKFQVKIVDDVRSANRTFTQIRRLKDNEYILIDASEHKWKVYKKGKKTVYIEILNDPSNKYIDKQRLRLLPGM